MLRIRRGQLGFSLVEILTAFTILSISLVAIYRAFSVSFMSTGVSGELALLSLEARSKMVEVGTFEQLVADGEERPLSGNWNWAYSIEPAKVMTGRALQDTGITLYEITLTGRTQTGRVKVFKTYKLLRLEE